MDAFEASLKVDLSQENLMRHCQSAKLFQEMHFFL